MPGDLAGLDQSELERRIDALRDEMKPIEASLAQLRVQRDILLTEKRRRERTSHKEARADLKAAMREGKFPSLDELVAAGREGSLEDYVYNLKTGGEVRLGFPGARAQTLAFTDGAQAVQARDLAEAFRMYNHGWDLGTPGRPGVRVHFPGTRQERLVPADDVYARPKEAAPA